MPIPVLPGNNPLWGGNVAKAVIPNYKDTGNFIQAAPESKRLSPFWPFQI